MFVKGLSKGDGVGEMIVNSKIFQRRMPAKYKDVAKLITKLVL